VSIHHHSRGVIGALGDTANVDFPLCWPKRHHRSSESGVSALPSSKRQKAGLRSTACDQLDVETEPQNLPTFAGRESSGVFRALEAEFESEKPQWMPDRTSLMLQSSYINDPMIWNFEVHCLQTLGSPALRNRRGAKRQTACARGNRETEPLQATHPHSPPRCHTRTIFSLAQVDSYRRDRFGVLHMAHSCRTRRR
jgi:hypothetical protein